MILCTVNTLHMILSKYKPLNYVIKNVTVTCAKMRQNVIKIIFKRLG